MQYEQIQYVPENQDPSITIETRDLVVKVIDNAGLSLAANSDIKSQFSKYGTNSIVPYSHHLGYHGLRLLYDKEEKRNLVVPLISWLNLQGVRLEGIENDPVDERKAKVLELVGRVFRHIDHHIETGKLIRHAASCPPMFVPPILCRHAWIESQWSVVMDL